MSYHIRHEDGRWLKTREMAAMAHTEDQPLGPDNADWVIVPGWDAGKRISFETLEEAGTLGAMPRARGFPVKLAEER